ncbi:SDR family NAD(P)-dependent oxidoreductase [Caulobacter segnis]|uniref:SDR family NAD(P)-dependent oxidoreductase n=1 Tax=Caulobacter segnis TaxID=88688 RepID=UPI00240F85CE|nr:SDR family NAD(P)-dependent oxidoreductase [Caulobacter segnis]MDG2522102.1 SDR family NAD(P)-dependent oxidoreductase [Caulobacter segnis]
MAQRVIVTGARGVLGRAVVEAFLAAGHRVTAPVRGDASSVAFSGEVAVIDGADLSDPAAARSAFERAKAALGGADVLVNVAGGFTFEMISDGSPAAWREMFAMNLETCANLSRVAASGLADGGAIVNVGSAAATTAGAGMAPYAASKAGVAKLTESLAAELKGRVRVNAVLPSVMDTPRNRSDMPDADPAAWTAPAAVADAIVFLASPQARAINGALVPVTNPASA